MSKRLYLLLLPLLVLALLLAACGGKPTQVAEEEGGFLLALPQITVDIDSQGVPSVAGFTAETVKQLTFGQLDLTGLRVDPALVNWFTQTNLQHVVLVHRNDGLYIIANNEPLPHIGWDTESLRATSDVATDFGLLDPRIAKIVKLFVPFVQRIGLNIAVRFPVAPGQEVIEVADANEVLSSITVEPTEDLAIARLHLNYDENGVPSVLDVSLNDVEEALGISLAQAKLSPALVQQMTNAGIQHVMVRTADNGLLLFVNGQPLPNLAWSEELLSNGAKVFGQLYPTDEFTLSREAVNVLLPMLNDIDGEVVLLFPLAPGAEAIPLP
ncbi:MAG: hypothetical protein D6791_01200 [Chloroflexi bacterium]|nr:MAG: hypothetical protein D6791_01200 [Chloroflexota bacterium]